MEIAADLNRSDDWLTTDVGSALLEGVSGLARIDTVVVISVHLNLWWEVDRLLLGEDRMMADTRTAIAAMSPFDANRIYARTL
jgi:hypothetical protein